MVRLTAAAAAAVNAGSVTPVGHAMGSMGVPACRKVIPRVWCSSWKQLHRQNFMNLAAHVFSSAAIAPSEALAADRYGRSWAASCIQLQMHSTANALIHRGLRSTTDCSSTTVCVCYY
jgi:hypothetical protein